MTKRKKATAHSVKFHYRKKPGGGRVAVRSHRKK